MSRTGTVHIYQRYRKGEILYEKGDQEFVVYGLDDGEGDNQFLFKQLITDWSDGTPVMVRVYDGTYFTKSDHTFPSNVHWLFSPNAKLKPDAGKTITIQGPIMGWGVSTVADIKTGDGTVTANSILSASSGKSGAVQFSGGSGILSSDESKFFWDDDNNALGLGTDAPKDKIHLHEPSSGLSLIKFTNTTTGETDTDGFDIGISAVENVLLLNRENTDMIFYTNDTLRMRIEAGGEISIGAGVDTAKEALDVRGGILTQDGNVDETLLANQGGAGKLTLSGLSPQIVFEDTNEGVDDKVIVMYYNNEVLEVSSLTDDGSGFDVAPILSISRDGNVGFGISTPNEGITLEAGVISLKETTTPVATTNYGKVYTKTDNKLYFQDGAGTEHEIAFV